MTIKLLYFKRLLFFTAAASAFYSCSIFDTKEQIPSYIHIDKIVFSAAADSSQGTSSSKITDAWVYVDEQLVGTYELPATFPVQYSGVHNIRVIPGVKQNGISSTRIKYPFYQGCVISATLTPKQTTVIHPTAQYFSAITFEMKEDFQAAGYQFTDTLDEGRLHLAYHTDAWGGCTSCQSVYCKLIGDTIGFQMRSQTTYSLAADGQPKFIELNYKCNHAFVVGLTYNGSTSPVVGINPSSTWNKVYINVTDQVQLDGQYGFYIAMQKLLTDQDVPELYLDNIKLIHQ